MRKKRLTALTTLAPSALGITMFARRVAAEFEQRLETARQAGYDEGYADARSLVSDLAAAASDGAAG